MLVAENVPPAEMDDQPRIDSSDGPSEAPKRLHRGNQPQLATHRLQAQALANLIGSVRSQPVFSEESRTRLRRSGWEVEEEPLLLVFDGDNGEQFAVPTRNANLRFVKQ